MPSVSEFADFIELLHARRQYIAARAPHRRHARPRLTSQLLGRAMAGLSDAEAELRAQNDALFDARTSVSESGALFRDLFDLAPVAYLVTDATARITQVNAAACTLLRKPENSLVGRSLARWVAQADRGAFREALARSATTSGVEDWPVCLVPLGAAPVECRVRVRVLRAPAGTVRGLAWVLMESAGDPFEGV